MRRFYFLLLLLVSLTTLDTHAQNQPLIEISCPGISTVNQLPLTAMEEILYLDDHDENLVLVRVTNNEIIEVPIPVGGVFDFLLSPTGEYLAMLTYASTVNLSIFDISNNTLQSYVTSLDIHSGIDFSWSNSDTVKIIETAQNENPRVFTIDINHTEIVEDSFNLAPFFENSDVRYKYSPDLKFLGLVTPDNFVVATVGGEILYNTDTFDYYSTLSSLAWSSMSQELIMVTDEWQFFDLANRNFQTLHIPPDYEFSHPVWSPNSELIAFQGIRLPLERPNALTELIVYRRSQNIFIDLCQSGVFSIQGQYNEVYWSSDSRWLAFIMETLEGWNLYAIDLDANTIAQIELDASGDVPKLLGWR